MDHLDSGLLTSVDKHGDRLHIIPAEVRGFFRKHRDWTQIVLLIIFLALPWTRINGHQSVLLDIPNREFIFLGLVLRAHDVPLLFFILGAGALGLAFVTSIWGRVWCGWACPQTVFIDAVFRRIERWTEGSYIQRRQLREQSLNFTKLRKVSFKWLLFVLVSSLIAHSFMAYFVGAEKLLLMLQKSPEQNLTYFILVTSFTAAVLFDFAWFREQFCIIMCPYGRIQSLLLDSKSLAVVYDEKRGEPRKDKKDPFKTGDCVSCNRCVQVCPTGIDIRNGLQMECIACTACIDACDEIMVKVKKPKGLIRYDTLDGSRISLTRPRSLIYMTVIVLMICGLAYALWTREPAHLSVLRANGLPYSYVKDEAGNEKILNQFKIHIQNQSAQRAKYELSLLENHPSEKVQIIVAENPLSLKSSEFREWYFFIRSSADFVPAEGKKTLSIRIRDLENPQLFDTVKTITVLGPQQ